MEGPRVSRPLPAGMEAALDSAHGGGNPSSPRDWKSHNLQTSCEGVREPHLPYTSPLRSSRSRTRFYYQFYYQELDISQIDCFLSRDPHGVLGSKGI